MRLASFPLFFFGAASFAQPGNGFHTTYDNPFVRFDTTLIHPGFWFVNSLNDDNYYKECVGPDTLDNGSVVCYGQDTSSNRYLFLQKDDSLYLLNKVHGTSFWNLGQVETEYKNSFMIIHDQGNGCPPTYELFSKKTAKNLLGTGIEFDDYLWFDHSLYLLYMDTSKKKIALFNVTTHKTEYYAVPADFPKYGSLNFELLDESTFTIRYADFLNFGDELEQSYTRTQP